MAAVRGGGLRSRLKLKVDGVVSKSIGGPIPNESGYPGETVRLHAEVTSLDLDRATHRLAVHATKRMMRGLALCGRHSALDLGSALLTGTFLVSHVECV